MRRHAIACTVALVALLLGCAVKGDAAREREITRETEASLDESARYIDYGVTIGVVVAVDDAPELIPGCPPLKVIREHHIGGMLDTWGEGNDGRPFICGPSKNPKRWYCSERQEPLILHGDDLPLWILFIGGEGVGKTTALAQWSFCRVLEHVGFEREIGITAPTNERMSHVLKAIKDHWRPEWTTRPTLTPTDRDHSLTFHAGPSVKFVSAHQSSKAEGSRIQGYNWVAHGGDELQDHHDKEADIVSRGRSAPGGIYKRLNTCTAKDATDWRTFVEKCIANIKTWIVERVPGITTPFLHKSHWDRMRDGAVTWREWCRRALAKDMGPEAQVYHCFTRTLEDGTPGNVRPIPLGAVDVTAEMLGGSTPNAGLLIGHDPGKRQHVSMFLKAYRFREDVRRGDQRPRWFVVDEVTSPDATIHSHAQEVLKRARTEWNCNTLDRKGQPDPDSSQVVVRIDPHSRAEKSDHPGRDVYTIWRSLGMIVRAAAYKPGANNEPAQIPRQSRLDMMNTLLCATSDTSTVRRLFILCDDQGKVAAPKLLAAFESMERNSSGEAEQEKKDANDLSHWPAAVGYGLWSSEYPRIARVAA